MEDTRLELRLGTFLRVGVLASALVVLVGGIVHLVRHADEPTDYSAFQEDRLPQMRSPRAIIETAVGMSGRGIIQLGLLLLIATPVARVGLSALGFARQRDFTYVALTLLVLGVLLYSLLLEGP